MVWASSKDTKAPFEDAGVGMAGCMGGVEK